MIQVNDLGILREVPIEENRELLERILANLEGDFPEKGFGVRLKCPVVFGDYYNAIEPNYSIRVSGIGGSTNYLLGAKTILKLSSGVTSNIPQLPFGGLGALRVDPEVVTYCEVCDDSYFTDSVRESIEEFGILVNQTKTLSRV